MFKDLFNIKEKECAFDGEKLEKKEPIRKCVFKILNTQIIHDAREATYYTLATCINEKGEIETVDIEGFKINENVKELKGAYIDYIEYDEDYYESCDGVIFVKDV